MAPVVRLALVMESNGVLLVDSRGHILRANRECERMFGYDAGALAGKTLIVEPVGDGLGLADDQSIIGHKAVEEGLAHRPGAEQEGGEP